MRVLAVLAVLAGPVQAQDAVPDGAALFDGADGLQPRLGRADGPVLPQGQFSCAGCHGADGRGGVEGGAQPAPPIDWTSLATATPQRPAYDDAGFARLLTQGITPSGRTISARMPRFQGSPQAIAALSAHLRGLDGWERQGLHGDAVNVALPADPGARDAALAAIAAFNNDGGAFGRRVVVADPAFVDLEATVATLLPRLHRAEQERVQELLSADPDLRPLGGLGPARRVAATTDELGPHLAALLSRGTEVQAVGPLPRAMAWALRDGQDARAAHVFAATLAALDLLRDMGRQPTRSRFDAMVDRLDLTPMIEVYRQTGN
ncbi:cytochrome c [uncultured Paracoccus sp.]|uniref:c-type cytochrome n=1 Tax=uncultured Paracoccus sp. TaxID=189685 RepID=UPI0025EE9372|nr:cytochrome c [uncultured Paracoccus sp.]